MEATRPVFYYGGQGFSPLGDKDRVVLPPQLRKTVRESSANARVLCLVKHDRWDCLMGFGLSRKLDLPGEIDREESVAVQAGKPFDRDTRYAQLFGFNEVAFDDSGRFVLPGFLKKLAKIADGVFFQGTGPFFTLWSPAVLATMGSGWEGAQATCAHLIEEAGRGRG